MDTPAALFHRAGPQSLDELLARLDLAPGTRAAAVAELAFQPIDAADDDRDRLPAALERIMGSNEAKPDSDCDGTRDGVEWFQPSGALESCAERNARLAEEDRQAAVRRRVRGFLLWDDGTLPSALTDALAGQGNPLEPIEVRLGPTTGISTEAVYVGEPARRWARRSGRNDVLAALIAILGDAMQLGVPPEAAQVNDEIRVRFGDDLMQFELYPQLPASND